MTIRTIILLFIGVLLSTMFVSKVMGRKPHAELKREQSSKESKKILKKNNIKTKQITDF